MSLVLFINGNLGLRILKYTACTPGVKVSFIVLNSEFKRSIDYVEEVKRVLELTNQNCEILLWGSDSEQFQKMYAQLETSNHAVSVLFGHILPQDLISRFDRGILNLHPSLLPIGRGANPISWGIVDKQVQGITLHLIDSGLDTGDIIFQKEIPTMINMSAGEIYVLAIEELHEAYSKYFLKWINGEFAAYKQQASDVYPRSSNEFNSLQILGESETSTFGSFVRRIQASTFSNETRPIFKDNSGNMWRIDFRLLPYQNFDKSRE